MNVNQLIEIINHCVPGKVRIGRIDLMEKFSFFEVEEKDARKVEKNMNGYELEGRRISVEPAQQKNEDKGKGRRKGTAQRRFERSRSERRQAKASKSKRKN